MASCKFRFVLSHECGTSIQPHGFVNREHGAILIQDGDPNIVGELDVIGWTPVINIRRHAE
jgi:hypothetical protein